MPETIQKELQRQTWKHYAFSSFLTFLAGAAMALIPEIDKLSVETLEWSVFIGVLLAGIRGGLKALLQAFLTFHKEWKARS